MRAVGVRDLKNRLSEYLRIVKSGEPVLVTERGVVIAELVPPGQATAAGERYPGLANLVRRGLANAVHENDPRAYPPMPRIAPEGTAQRLIDEDREDRL